MFRTGLAVVVLAGAVLAQPAAAHFQEILPSADVLPEGGAVTLSLLFTHPFAGGPVMEMARPAAFGVVQGGVVTDLSAQLVQGETGGATSWSAAYDLPEPGAAVFYVSPQPYWEAAEGKFIRHHAKVVVDSFASGQGWDALVGLPVEIRPLTRPTGLWVGNAFSGVVLKAGQPVPFAEIEVEMVNDTGLVAPNDAFVTQVITADANGTFSYTMPHAGWWGFAALVQGDTPLPAPDGSMAPVEEGALIWVHTTPMGQ